MTAQTEHLIPWELPSLGLDSTNKLPPEPGIYIVYRRRRVLFIDCASTNLRNRWFKQNITRALDDLDSIQVAYQTVSEVKAPELERYKKELIKLYDPQCNGTTQQHSQEYRAVIQKLKKENRILKALIKKERVIHRLALCQSKMYLASKLLAEMETNLGKSQTIEDWIAQEHTTRSGIAISSMLEEISEIMEQFTQRVVETTSQQYMTEQIQPQREQ